MSVPISLELAMLPANIELVIEPEGREILPVAVKLLTVVAPVTLRLPPTETFSPMVVTA